MAERDEQALVKEAAELRHRRRVATVLLAGGGIAILAGIFAGSVMVALLGAGWIFGGAAVASTIPQR
jgi:hypothetical protein